MLPQTEIQRYGGKAAIFNYIRERLPDMPIPSYVVREAGQPIEGLLGDFSSMKRPIIVRSSSPYEYGDFEGIFESVRDIKNQVGLERAIKVVENSATSKRAQEYACQNSFIIDGKIHI